MIIEYLINTKKVKSFCSCSRLNRESLKFLNQVNEKILINAQDKVLKNHNKIIQKGHLIKALHEVSRGIN